MNSKRERIISDEKICFAVAVLLNDGFKNITGYQIAKVLNVGTNNVYSHLKKHLKD